MADKTLGIKVTEEVYDKAKAAIEMSGLTAKDWLEKVVALHELNSLKEGISGDYSNDLAELEVHTTRIYSLISNMIARSTYLKDNAVKEVAEKLEGKESIIVDLQNQNTNLKASVKEYELQQKQAEEQINSLETKLTSMENTLDNNQSLINEYKEKNDTLNGLVSQFKGYAEENERLKMEIADLNINLTNRAETAEKESERLARQVKNGEEELIKTKEQHQVEIAMLIDKKDIERDKALVEVERKNQEQQTAANEKVRTLYDEIAQIRKSYEDQIDTLKQEIESIKASKQDVGEIEEK